MTDQKIAPNGAVAPEVAAPAAVPAPVSSERVVPKAVTTDEDLPTGFLPGTVTPQQIAETQQLVKELAQFIHQEVVGSPEMAAEVEKIISQTILGRPGSFAEVSEYTATQNRVVLDKHYGVPEGASADERAKIISSAIASDLEQRFAAGDYAAEQQQVIKELMSNTNKSLGLPEAASAQETINAAKARGVASVAESMGLPQETSVDDLRAQLEAQRKALIEEHRAEKK